MSIRQFIISFAAFSVASACLATESDGPCFVTGDPVCGSQVCDLADMQCCPVTTVPAVVTSTTVVTDATATTVSSATVTSSVTSSSTTTCVDRVNPSTGVSDCTALSYLCNDSTYYAVMTQQCPRTCGRCNSTSTSSSTSCVDLVNPSTGVSDCPARASLCNDSNYYTLMTTQCPRTCGRCSTSSSTTSSSSSTTCADRSNPLTGVSECPSRAALCNNSVYYTLMTQQCPVTCGRCNTTSTSTTTCTDRVNPTTGTSDCPARAALCNNSVYYDIMTQQCPATCGRCNASSSTATASSSTTASTTCVDAVNAATGISDCPNRRALCTNAAYISLMRTQCPLTCGFCTSG